MNILKEKPVLITGGCGMVGSHLVDYYYERGEKVTATFYEKPTINLNEVRDKANYVPCDVRIRESIQKIIEEKLPDTIFHLAAQSYPTVSWQKPAETIDTNVNGTINLFESVKYVREKRPDYDPMIVIACSSAEYGAALTPENTPVKEETALLPLHPYGVSKVGQDLLGFQYFVNDRIRNIRARIFNTTGPRKVNDVVSDFTKRAIQWQKGEADVLRVGNLTTKRAITDVRDLIKALLLLNEKGAPGEVYNISGEKAYDIGSIITIIENHLQQKIPTQTDPALIRVSDEPIIFGDSSRLKATTGWRQEYTLERTVTDMLEYWKRVL